ncbi:MAG: T9SS type A sorting domain-containing protein [Rhodothermales bacterium]|nr:T9SS type A sorting domain-containing protein [Rhodothermales bacterium]
MRSLLAVLVLLLAVLPAQAQQPANALPESWLPTESFGPADTQATPDTTTPWRYYPLHVGDIWEYEENDGMMQRYLIEKDTLLNGKRYFKQRREVYFADLSPGQSVALFLRYDTTRHQVIIGGRSGNEGLFLETECPLNVEADSLHTCSQGERYYVRLFYDGLLVFGEGAGRGLDTVRTSVKSFATLSEIRYAAGIGLVYKEVEGHTMGLSYYRVGNIEHGQRRIAVAAEDEAVTRRGVLRMEQTGPQPTRDRATLRVALPEAARVTVEVFDLVGRRVAVLLDGPQAAGTHEVAVDTRALLSGMYLVRLTSGSQVRTARLHVLR